METFYKSIRSPMISILEQAATKKLIAMIVVSPFMAGFQGWIIGFIVDYCGQNIAVPVINYFFQKVGYEYEVINGEHTLAKIKTAVTINEWDAAINKV